MPVVTPTMPPQAEPPQDQRDRGLDSLRGLMLLGMAMNHIASRLQIVTDHPFGYTSTAEGFVFLSGLVAGMVYTRRRERNGPAVAARASWLRACTIYCYHLALLVGVWAWVNLYFVVVGMPAGNSPAMMLHRPGLSLLSGVLLTNQPPLLDILPMYAGFMLLLPVVLSALDAGHRGRVLAISFAGWLLTNLFWPDAPVEMGALRTGAFNWGAWQLMFFAGTVCGHARATGQALLPRLAKVGGHVPAPAFSPANPAAGSGELLQLARPCGHGTCPPTSNSLSARVWLIIPAVALCAWCFMIRHWYWPAPSVHFADWVNKNNLAPVRLLNTFALFLLIHLAFVRWSRAFAWSPLAMLGRHSLAVFSTHIAVAYVLFAFPQVVAATPARTWIGTSIMIAALFAVALWRDNARQRNVVRVPARPAGTPWGRAA